MMLAIAPAIDAADLPFLGMLAIILLLGFAGLVGVAVTPWSRIQEPQGLEDWKRRP